MKNDPLVGRKLANFQIERPIGRGGMAQIYYGIDTALDRPVAIKVIDARFQGDPEYARRFVDEAKIVARWKHENIVSVYYADNEGDLYYFAMEFIDGAGLDELLETYVQNGELMPHDDVLRIGKAMAKALDYAHKQGVVHRDFKPSNVMISRDDRVILADFGLALDINQGSMGQIFGTPHYIAPEQARRSSDAVPQSDIYALGVVLYEMLTGVVPFDDESAMAVAVQHMSEPPPPPREINPALSKATEKVLLKALEKEPQDRYQSGAELMKALDKALKQMDKESQADSDILPPFAVSGQPSKRVSKTSILDMLAVELDRDEPTKPAIRPPQPVDSHMRATKQMRPKRTVPAQAEATVIKSQKAKSGGSMKFLIGIGIIVVILIAIGAFFLFSNGNNASTPENTAAVVAQNTADNTGIEETGIAETRSVLDMESTAIQLTNIALEAVPTNTVAAVVVEAATNTLPPPTATVEAATNTLPPPTATLPPTDDIAATNQAQMDLLATANMLTQVGMTQAAQIAVPTVAFPNGRPIEMSYNSAGFYLRNSSDTAIFMRQLSFSALNAQGSKTGYNFDGTSWSLGYNKIDRNGRCVGIELLDQPAWTRPNNCVAAASSSGFNSLLTFQDVDQQIFWLPRNAGTQFAVYWDGVEVIRCAMDAGLCQTNVGN